MLLLKQNALLLIYLKKNFFIYTYFFKNIFSIYKAFLINILLKLLNKYQIQNIKNGHKINFFLRTYRFQ